MIIVRAKLRKQSIGKSAAVAAISRKVLRVQPSAIIPEASAGSTPASAKTVSSDSAMET